MRWVLEEMLPTLQYFCNLEKLENSLLKEALAMSSENCEELMKQSNQEQVRACRNE